MVGYVAIGTTMPQQKVGDERLPASARCVQEEELCAGVGLINRTHDLVKSCQLLRVALGDVSCDLCSQRCSVAHEVQLQLSDPGNPLCCSWRMGEGHAGELSEAAALLLEHLLDVPKRLIFELLDGRHVPVTHALSLLGRSECTNRRN